LPVITKVLKLFAFSFCAKPAVENVTAIATAIRFRSLHTVRLSALIILIKLFQKSQRLSCVQIDTSKPPN